MIRVGLTGGIAAGKSTVARRLESKGALVVDADIIGHEVTAPGTQCFKRVVSRFGEEIIAPDGTIDRGKLSGIVFADSGALTDLENITHPEIFRRLGHELSCLEPSASVVVVEAALLVETSRFWEAAMPFDCLVVVSAPREVQAARLIHDRGMSKQEANARIDSQSSLDEKLAVAEYVIRNEGSIEDLRTEVDRVWEQLVARDRP